MVVVFVVVVVVFVARFGTGTGAGIYHSGLDVFCYERTSLGRFWDVQA